MVTNNTAARQFEIRTEQGIALLRYVPNGTTLDLVHTEVPDALQDQGIGATLARAALEHAKAERLTVIPSCPFVRRYIERHPEFATLVRGEQKSVNGE